MAKQESTTVAIPAVPRPDDEMLRSITSIDDAFAALAELGTDVVDIADVIGSGFSLLDDKDKGRLVGVPMLLIAWAFSPGLYGQFVTTFVITATGEKYIVNDGSTGICKQLAEFTGVSGRQNGLRVMKGLRRSDYLIDKATKEPVGRDFAGETEPASTFYLDTSK